MAGATQVLPAGWIGRGSSLSSENALRAFRLARARFVPDCESPVAKAVDRREV